MKEFLMVAGVKMPGIGGGGWLLRDLRELSCGPCGPGFVVNQWIFYCWIQYDYY